MAHGNLIAQDIPSFSGGVSQQPDNLRYPNQVQEQINGYSSVVDGLEKRPPLIHVAKLRGPVPVGRDKFHIIDRDEKEQYILRVSEGELEVWDLAGNKKEVKTEEGVEYLQLPDGVKPIDAFSCQTIADYTFILNKTVECKMTEKLTDDGLPNTTLCFLKNVQYAKTYAVFIDDEFCAGVVCPDGGEPNQAVSTTTSFVTKRLHKLLTGAIEAEFTTYEDLLDLTGGTSRHRTARNPDFDTNAYTWEIIGDSTLACTPKDSSKGRPNITLKDGFGGTNYLPIKGFVTAQTKLPPIAPDGYKVHVKGISQGDEDDYWLYWDDERNVWQECAASKIPYEIDDATMPWAIRREADGTFSFVKLKWGNREVGDEDTNPDPTFIGNKINDIFFYRNRLGLLSDESICLSATSDFYNFWYNSAVAIIDTDPIDVSVSSTKVAKLTHAVPFSRELMLFSREGQFVLGSDGVLTPKTVKVDQMTSFDYSGSCAPLAIGPNIFYVNEKVDSSALMRYYTVQDVAEMKNAEDTTAHVPTYLPKGIRYISGNSTYNLLLCNSEDKPENLYVYKFLFNGGQPVQQSWSKWTFDNDLKIILTAYANKKIYMLSNNKNGLYLDSMMITSVNKDYEDEPYRLYMDYKTRYEVPLDETYHDYGGYTEISFMDVYGSIPSTKKPFQVVEARGAVHTIEPEQYTEDGTGFIIFADLRGTTVFIGKGYPYSVTLSEIGIKSVADGQLTTEEEGRLQLRYFWLNYAKSGYMTVDVVDSSRKQKYHYVNTDKLTGDSECVLGETRVRDGRFRFPIQRRNKDISITITSNQPTPLNIISGGWEGFYVRRNRKI